MKNWILLLAFINVNSFPTLERKYVIANVPQQQNATTLIEQNPEESAVRTETKEEFPEFITTREWKEGSALIAFLIGVYCFVFLALICDSYFLPCIERLCECLEMSEDIAAATFMAMATSAPEFFVNVVGTFITQSDIGVGTIIGSALFNTLGVAALGGLAASKPIQVDWWPVVRDCTIYLISISLLVFMSWDGHIYWYEGMVLFFVYFIYFGIMFNNRKISERVMGLFKKEDSSTSEKVAKDKLTEPIVYVIDYPINYYSEFKTELGTKNVKTTEEVSEKKCQLMKVGQVIVWPLKILLWCTVPDPKTSPKLFPLTFIVCIIFIGMNSYLVSWMISVIGHALQVPSVVLGLTFLAAGGCLPEAISIIIMSRRGNGKMGVSNALGANTMNILLSLGLPWFVKTLIMGPSRFIQLESDSIVYTIMGLILVVLVLLLALFFNKFRLSRTIGIILLILYVVFLSLAIVSMLLLPNVEESHL